MFQTVLDRVQIVQELFTVMAKVREVKPDTEWSGYTQGMILDLSHENLMTLSNVSFSMLNVVQLNKYVDTLDNVSEFCILNVEERILLNGLRVIAVGMLDNR